MTDLPPLDRPLRVLTMNIWTFSPPYEARMRALRAGIERLDPDLLAFQEAGYAGGRHQVAEVLDGLGYHLQHQYELAPGTAFDNACCLASRWPLEAAEVVSFNVSERSSRYPYALLLARAAAPPPVGPVLFACAKPSWELCSELERERQAVILADAIDRLAAPDGFPPIVAGDFDAALDRASIRFLAGMQSLGGCSAHFRDAWAEAGDGSPGHTWEWANPYARAQIADRLHMPGLARRIDYIWLGSPHLYPRYAAFDICRVELAQPVDGAWASDHYAVYAEIATAP